MFVGSGFVVRYDEETGPLMVTNAHVVMDSTVLTIQVPAKGQKKYKAKVVMVNPDWDIAFVKLDKTEVPVMRKNLKPESLIPLSLYKEEPHPGMKVATMGFPLGQSTAKVTTGVMSGVEDLGDFVEYEMTAPISPGNSGGPLFVAGTHKVLGINFAAKIGGAQNTNYAIPSWRVHQMMNAYDSAWEKAKKHGDGADDSPGLAYNPKKCMEGSNWACTFHIPKPMLTASPGGGETSEYYGCKDGLFISSMSPRSFLRAADPPIEDNSFLLSVDGIKLDAMGMGRNPKYVDRDVTFYNLMYMRDDVETVEMETCSCGEKQTHKVHLGWKREYEPGVYMEEQPSIEKVDYEDFARVTVRPLTINVAKELIKMGRIDLLPRVLHNDKPELVITDVSRVADDRSISLRVGSIVKTVNGHNATTLEQYRAGFKPSGERACKASHRDDDEDSETVFAEGDKKPKALKKEFWRLETEDGIEFVVDYEFALKQAAKDGRGRLSDTITKAAREYGLKIDKHAVSMSMEQEYDEDAEGIPIEERQDVMRAGVYDLPDMIDGDDK